MTDELLLMSCISNCLCWKWLIFIRLICYHLLMNADPAGVQRCSQIIIMYEKQGTISDKRIVFMCLWQEPISVKVLVKSKVPGYGITNSTWLTNICIKKAFGRLSQNNSLKHINKFIISSNISVCMLCYCHNVIILMCSMLYHKTISKYETHWYWTTHIENVMYSTHLGTMKYSPWHPASLQLYYC